MTNPCGPAGMGIVASTLFVIVSKTATALSLKSPMYAFGIFIAAGTLPALALPAAVVAPTGAVARAAAAALVVAAGAFVAAVPGAALGGAVDTGAFVGAGVSVAFVLPPHAARKA